MLFKIVVDLLWLQFFISPVSSKFIKVQHYHHHHHYFPVICLSGSIVSFSLVSLHPRCLSLWPVFLNVIIPLVKRLVAISSPCHVAAQSWWLHQRLSCSCNLTHRLTHFYHQLYYYHRQMTAASFDPQVTRVSHPTLNTSERELIKFNATLLLLFVCAFAK